MSTTRDAYLEDLDRQYAMEAAEGEPVDLSHDGLAIEMADTWQVDARYLALRNTWLFWTGQQWQPDQVLLHMTRARSYLRGSAEALIQSAQKDTQHADDPGAGQKNREVALLRPNGRKRPKPS